MDRFSNFFLQLIRDKIFYVYTQRLRINLTCSVLLHYLEKFENPKMLQNFHVERDNVFD